ncbi:PAS domain-containing protein [Methylobrevis albus]|uniref:PAS domain-containing protein n=1 Tax=Methylobrevis albus TaxID=2793297 RepID=A0A931N0N7_9HYPH|nr:PAS domain-containing protein [Methylobrevis albus]MBH0238976.1 PAS domain-containing protein [Methylobrevis albus]
MTQTLFEYWTRLRGRRVAPDRHEVEPGDIREILGDTFILEATDRQTYSVRLAGTRLCAAYCRELKGRNLLDLWTGKDREAVASLLAAIVEDGAAAIVGLAAQNERGQSVPVEIMFLPLRHGGSRNNRIIGCFAPHEQPYWLGLHPIVRQPIMSLRLIWPDEAPAFLRKAEPADAEPLTAERPRAAVGDRRLRQVGGRTVAHLTVYEGGRQE